MLTASNHKSLYHASPLLRFSAIILVLLTGCNDFDIDSKESFQKIQVKTIEITPNRNEILELQEKFDAYELSKSKTISEAHSFQYLTKPRDPYQFSTSEDFELMLSVVSVSHEIGVNTISFYPHLDTLRSVWGLSHSDLHWLNHKGEVVVEGFLYQITPEIYIQTDLKTGKCDTTFSSIKSQDKKPQSFSGIQEVDELIIEATGEQVDTRSFYEYIVGTDNQLYDVKTTITNKSTSLLGVKRSIARTQIFAKLNGQSSYSDAALSKLGPLFTEVKMISRYNILFKGCQTRTNVRSSDGPLAEVSTGRCPNNGVTSYHTAYAYNKSFPIVVEEYLY